MYFLAFKIILFHIVFILCHCIQKYSAQHYIYTLQNWIQSRKQFIFFVAFIKLYFIVITCDSVYWKINYDFIVIFHCIWNFKKFYKLCCLAKKMLLNMNIINQLAFLLTPYISISISIIKNKVASLQMDICMGINVIASRFVNISLACLFATTEDLFFHIELILN